MEQATDTKPCPATVTCRRTSIVEIEIGTLPLDTASWIEERVIDSRVDNTSCGVIIERSVLQDLCGYVSDTIIKYILKTYSDADYYYFKLT